MKGISPLIAAVLLIAVTMTIAGLLAFWASSFIRERVEAWGEEECLLANFRVYSCNNVGWNNVTMILENLKDVELKNVTAYIRYTNDTVSAAITNLSPDNILTTTPSLKTFTFDNPELGVAWTEIVIKTHCPEISITNDCD